MPLGPAALEGLLSAMEELREALDGTDVARIESATARVGQAADGVRAIGAWRADPAVRDRVKALVPLLESARVRVNLLTDHAGQRLSLLAARGAEGAPLVYGR